MDRKIVESWFQLSFPLQFSNIGSEVARAIKWKNEGNEHRKIQFCNKAIELLQRSIQDQKNSNRTHELTLAIEELQDYFLGENTYNTTDEILTKYYDAFLPKL